MVRGKAVFLLMWKVLVVMRRIFRAPRLDFAANVYFLFFFVTKVRAKKRRQAHRRCGRRRSRPLLGAEPFSWTGWLYSCWALIAWPWTGVNKAIAQALAISQTSLAVSRDADVNLAAHAPMSITCAYRGCYFGHCDVNYFLNSQNSGGWSTINILTTV